MFNRIFIERHSFNEPFGKSYTLEILRDGCVSFMRNGEWNWVISAKQLRALNNLIDEVNFLGIKPSEIYTIEIDIDKVSTTVCSDDGRERTITNEFGYIGWPNKLLNIDNEIVKITGVKEYLKKK